MQIDRWTIHTEQDSEDSAEEGARHPIRPRASLLNGYGLKEQRVIPNPRTPIPARASAQPAKQPVRRTSKLPEESDVTQLPTMPPTPPSWQDDVQDFVVESSVAGLSLSRYKAIAIDTLDTIPPPLSPTIDELDTIPPQLSPVNDRRSTIPLYPAIDELDTVPQLSPSLDRQKTMPPPMSPAIDELVTQPPQKKTTPAVQKNTVQFEPQNSLFVPTEAASSESKVEGISWTTAQGKDSWLAQRVASKKRDAQKTRKGFNPLDSLRWWLLYPGRIEFLLWLNGAIVLVVVTFLLLFATTLSMGWLNIGGATKNGSNSVQNAHASATRLVPAQTPCTSANAKTSQCRSTTVSSSGLQLTLVDNNVLYANTPIYLHGQGFSVNGTIAFTYDAQLPCHPNITQTNAQGTFTVLLLLGNNVQAGKHQIVALDMASSHAVKVLVDIAPTSTGNIVSSSTGQLPGGNGQGTTKPVGQTPVPVAPTVAVSPTLVPTQAPSPTVGVSPSPTVGMTPTAIITATPPITKKTGRPQEPPLHLSYLALRNTLYNESADGHFSINPWLWVAILGYMLSMSMLGLAGLLYRRKRRQSV